MKNKLFFLAICIAYTSLSFAQYVGPIETSLTLKDGTIKTGWLSSFNATMEKIILLDKPKKGVATTYQANEIEMIEVSLTVGKEIRKTELKQFFLGEALAKFEKEIWFEKVYFGKRIKLFQNVYVKEGWSGAYRNYQTTFRYLSSIDDKELGVVFERLPIVNYAAATFNIGQNGINRRFLQKFFLDYPDFAAKIKSEEIDVSIGIEAIARLWDETYGKE